MNLAIGASRPRWRHAFFAFLAASAAIGFACLPVQLAPAPGLVELSEAARVSVPGGHVNAAGGNYFHAGASLSLDTRLGEYSLGVVYNSAQGWTFGVDVSYQNGNLRDASGARIPLAALADGAAAPGTHWVKLDGTRAKTKGGLVHEFDPLTSRLAAMYWSSALYPRLRFVPVQLGGVTRTERIEQCTSASACTLAFALTHDGAGRIVRIDDRAGRSARFTYDASGRLSSSRDGLDVARGWPGERYEYVGNFLAAIVSSEGERIEIASDAAGRATQVRAVGAGDPTWRFTYGFVNATSVATTTSTDPLGHATTFAIDTLHRVQSIANPLGERTTFTWSGQRPASRTLPDGTATRWTWADDDIATETLPSGNVRRFTYAPGGVNRDRPNARALAELGDTLGLVERRGYDAQGRLTSSENGAGEATTFSYAADESLARIELPGGAATHFDATGEHGHPTRVSLDGVAWKDLALDAVGNALTGARPSPYSGGVAQAAYDEDRNPSTYFVLDHPEGATPTSHAIALEYRSDRQLTRVARPYGGEITWLRDALGRVTELRERVSLSATPANAWSVTRYEYDLAGRMLAVERANGMRSETAYDAAGRVLRQRALRQGAVEREVEFEYAQGRLARAYSPAGDFDEQLTYDASGQARAVRHTLGETTRVARDVRGRTVSVAFAMQGGAPLVTLTSAYDDANREISAAALGVDVVRRTYQGGRISERSYGNGVQVTSYAWPGLGVESAKDIMNAMGPVAHCDYDRSAGFDAALVADDCTVFPLQPLKGDLTQSYGYASSTQPIGADRRLVSSLISTGQARFTYDHLSNVSGSTLIEYLSPWSAIYQRRSVGFNAEHNRALTTRDENPVSPATWQHAYDEAGFETSRTATSAQGGAKTTTFAWTATGRIAQIATDGVVDAGFTYDALGRRASLTRNGYTRHWRFGGVVEFAFTGAPLWIDLGEVSINPLGYHRYRVPDARGNTQFVFDSAGALVHTATYGAYGEAHTRGQTNIDFGFARGTHIATGAGEFVWLGERLLDPRTGRFNSPDPVWNPINAYAYTFGNPAEFWDESGRHPGHAGGFDQHREIALAENALLESTLIAVGATAIAVVAPNPATVGSAVYLTANGVRKAIDLQTLRALHEIEFSGSISPDAVLPPGFGGFEPPPILAPHMFIAPIPFLGTPNVEIYDCTSNSCLGG
jgi:RHS repeat-associated protein